MGSHFQPTRDEDVSALTLRIDQGNERPNYPIVTILVDGEDRLGRLDGGFIGFDPEELLDTGALMPGHPPRRVAVYRCSCGEAGCACIAPVIEQSENRVVWSDFRDYTGVFVRPLVDHVPRGGTALGVGSITFDAEQYLREVERAMGDRSWESDARLTARLLREHLELHFDELANRGYWRGWVAPSWEVDGEFHVDFIAPTGQIVVALRPSSADPTAAALEMADEVLRTDPALWNVTINNAWPDDSIRAAIEARARGRR